MTGRPAAAVIVTATVLIIAVGLLVNRPGGFVPPEDQGYFIMNVQLPEGATIQRTEDVVFELAERVNALPGVRDVVSVAGSSLVGNVNAPYYGFVIPILEPWSERGPEASAIRLIEKVRGSVADYQRAQVQVFNAPPIPGVGSTGAVQLQMQGLAFQGPTAMANEANAFIAALNRRPEIGAAFTSYTASVPQYKFDIARDKAEEAGVAVGRLFDVMQAYLGSAFVNEFNRFGQTYNVFVQADQTARDEIADLADLSVRNENGAPVPLDTLIEPRFTTGPEAITRYNLFPAVEIRAQGAPGVSSGEVVAAVQETAAGTLGPDFGFEWTGATYQQKQSAGWAPVIFALAIALVFLIMAAQFESLSMPFVILLTLPFAVFGAVAALVIAGLPLDIFAQIGLLMLVGLSAKNAILIVEFARTQQNEGMTPREATLRAAHLRLRPILMTAFSFILGVLPLVLSTGAGANARISLGTTVIGGMIATTVLSLVLVPALYLMVEERRARAGGSARRDDPA